MLPDYFQCSACDEKFTYPFRDAHYYIGEAPIGKSVGAARNGQEVESSACIHTCG